MTPLDTDALVPQETITSTANTAIKAIRALEMRKNRDREGVFVAEGLRHVTEGITAGRTLKTLVFRRGEEKRPALRAALRACAASGGRAMAVNDMVLGKLARRDNAQTVLGVFEQIHPAEDLWLSTDSRLWIVLEEVRDPGNLGTIIRTADALGIDGVVLVGPCCDPFSTEAVRASMGSILRLPPVRITAERFADLRPRFPGRVHGTHLAGSVDLRSPIYDNSAPQLLVMGNEQKGLSAEMAALCDHLIRIPMADALRLSPTDVDAPPAGSLGGADSLNLAAATAIAAFHLMSPHLTTS